MVSTTYTIQMASKLSGVGVHTIRAWEKRYKALEPSRDASGHRTYAKADIEKLILLSELCLLGYTISKVAGLETPELKKLLLDLGKSPESLENNEFNLVNETKLTVDPDQSMPILNFALKSYKLDVISQELTKLKQLLSSKDFALKILLPLAESLEEIESGGSYSGHQGEALRSLIRFHMGYNLYHPLVNKDKGAHVIVSGIDGDFDEIGLGLLGLLCNHYGFHYTYLGQNISHEALGDLVKSLEGNVVILGFKKSSSENFIEKISSRLDANVDLVVFGKNSTGLEKISSKRLTILKDFDAVDDYLSKRTH